VARLAFWGEYVRGARQSASIPQPARRTAGHRCAGPLHRTTKLIVARLPDPLPPRYHGLAQVAQCLVPPTEGATSVCTGADRGGSALSSALARFHPLCGGRGTCQLHEKICHLGPDRVPSGQCKCHSCGATSRGGRCRWTMKFATAPQGASF
jgi:hypothetical protein